MKIICKELGILLLVFVLFAFVLQSCKNDSRQHIALKGPYMGQEVPSTEARLFAPGVISNGLPNRDFTMSPDGDEIFVATYTSNFQFATLLVTQQKNGVWSQPEVPEFASDPRYKYLEPAFNNDGTRLYFMSTLPNDSTENAGDEDIWMVEKNSGKWGTPVNVGFPVNTKQKEYFPSLTNAGTLYFTRNEPAEGADFIYRSKWEDGSYQTPERLPKQVNCGRDRFNAFIAPDESYLLIPAVGVEEGIRSVQYYIVFRNNDDTWSEPVNMGPGINAARGNGWSMSLTPDQKYLFFMSFKEDENRRLPEKLSLEFFKKLAFEPNNGNADIYWIDASVIDDLKAKNGR